MVDRTSFGVCPRCNKEPDFGFIGPSCWAVCMNCKVCWYHSSNEFRNWVEMTPQQWRNIAVGIAHYELITLEEAQATAMKEVENDEQARVDMVARTLLQDVNLEGLG